MANKLRGEVGFEADGKSYTLAFSINALCQMEDRIGVSVADVGTALSGKRRYSTLRSLFWCALCDYHPGLTEQDAGRIMAAIGTNKADALVAEAFKLAFPDPGPLDGEAAASGQTG